MDEIDYFPKRDKFKVQKDVGSDWNKLKKQKTAQPAKAKPPRSSPEKEKKQIVSQHISLNSFLPAFMFSCLIPIYDLS